MEHTEETDTNVNKRLLKEFSRKRVLFLENDHTLSSAVGNFWKWCLHNRVEHNALFNISALPMDYVMDQIGWFDVLAFQTTWTYPIAKEMNSRISEMKDRKIVLECYIHEPSWWHKPKGVVHDVFVLASSEENMNEWEFHKLRLNKAIWEK